MQVSHPKWGRYQLYSEIKYIDFGINLLVHASYAPSCTRKFYRTRERHKHLDSDLAAAETGFPLTPSEETRQDKTRQEGDVRFHNGQDADKMRTHRTRCLTRTGINDTNCAHERCT